MLVLPDLTASTLEPDQTPPATRDWPDRRILDLLSVDAPIVQAPMAGIATADLATAVACAGGLASLPCTMLTPQQMRAELAAIRRAAKPVNVNFLCHIPTAINPAREAAWRGLLDPYYVELGLDSATTPWPIDIPTLR